MSENHPCSNSKKKRPKKRTSEKRKSCTDLTENAQRNPLDVSMELLQVAPEQSVDRTPPPIANRKAAGSNWEVAISERNGSVGEVDVIEKDTIPTGLSKSARRREKLKAQRDNYLAMDCEMVGVGFNGQEDMLARVSIVNKRGEVILDKFVKPLDKVTDYRTSVSGIRPHDIENAEDFDKVQDEVVQLLQGKILVGHGIRNDLAVLHIKHPFASIRDTATYKPLRCLVANGRTPSLKRLSQAILGLEIQTGEHNSVEDARAAMNIYLRVRSDWENYLKKHQHKRL